MDQTLPTTTAPESPAILKPPDAQTLFLENPTWEVWGGATASQCLKLSKDCTGKKSGLGISTVNFRELGDIYPEDFVIPLSDVQMLLLLEK